jgi:PAS domain S-box-containing protein
VVRKRLLHIAGGVLLAISVVLVIWQGSFTFGDFAPTSIEQTYLFWAVSTVIFLLMVTLGFMLFRIGVKLYVERHAGTESRGLKAKMVIGALALSFIPMFFLVVWSISILNRNLDKWFSRPAANVRENLLDIGSSLDEERRRRAQAEANWLATLPQIQRYLATGLRSRAFFDDLCARNRLGEVFIENRGQEPLMVCAPPKRAVSGNAVQARAPLLGHSTAMIVVYGRMPVDLARVQAEIKRNISEYDQLTQSKRATRTTYILLLALITLFVLFVATWLALFLSRLVIIPISALLSASREVRQGNLAYRVDVQATDELASLVQAFNEMTQALETNARELESRRRFIEAILENIPSGVVSIAADGRIRMTNRALGHILPQSRLQDAETLDHLFPAEEARELRYLMNRARRTRVASHQVEFEQDGHTRNLSITMSALEDKSNSGFVVVIEDTSDILRAQKAAAWREVARRIAHEMKNPLTPITLCAERIARQVDRASRLEGPPPPDMVRVLKECSATVTEEVESVRNLVDEFWRFSRFPAANPASASLNEVVEGALAVFAGRLDGIELTRQLAEGLPLVSIDRDQFKRVIVNLIDNSAEAMKESPTKRLLIATRAAGPDAVELEVADTGCGVSVADKEKLFLPYFSTKGRGTGLGLAIVSHIVAEHGAQIRAEDNYPAGARFILEIPALAAEAQVDTVGSRG